jgi:hypothetical protein
MEERKIAGIRFELKEIYGRDVASIIYQYVFEFCEICKCINLYTFNKCHGCKEYICNLCFINDNDNRYKCIRCYLDMMKSL